MYRLTMTSVQYSLGCEVVDSGEVPKNHVFVTARTFPEERAIFEEGRRLLRCGLSSENSLTTFQIQFSVFSVQ